MQIRTNEYDLIIQRCRTEIVCSGFLSVVAHNIT